MTVGTTLPPRNATSPQRRWRTARSDLTRAWASIAKTAGEARRRYRRPSLVIASFGCADAAAWTTFGLGAGLLALGASLFVFEMIGDEE